MKDEELEAYKDMWGPEKEFYVLSRRDDGSYSIFDLRHNAGLIIEKTEVAREVVRRMLLAGVRVGDPFDLQLRKEIIKSRLRG